MSERFRMSRPRLRRIIAGVLVVLVATLLALPSLYGFLVTTQLARALDAKHGRTSWFVLWRAADAQPGEGVALFRTLYVRYLFPRFQEITPWKSLHFTHKTTTPNRPWHYAVCVVSAGREVTYYWSIRQHRWTAVWDNHTRHFPAEVQRDYAARLRNVERKGGLNWSRDDADEV